MSKDVKRPTLNQQENNSIQDEITDPNLFATKAIKQRIKERHLKFQAAQIYTQALLSLVTAPFVTTHVSLQLSVIPHKNLYGDVAKQDSQALAKISKEITVQDRRKFELLVKSGASGTNQPFRAPIYGSYAEVWRGLSNQGFLGFYKGNFLGLAYTLCNSSVRFSTINMLDYSNYTFYHKGGSFIRGSVAFLTSSLIDMVTQPLQTLQSRFILQNRLPNFCLYRSILEAFKKHKRNPLELYRGWMGHALKNAVLGVTWGLYDKNNPFETYLVSTFFSHLFSYPIFTAIRRIQCQSSLPGMIPKRYGGTIHALRLIAQEEGIQGLYRGFIAYAFATSFVNGFILLSSSFLNSAIEE